MESKKLYMETIDITGVLFYVWQKDFTISSFVNEQVNIMYWTDKKYKEFVIYKEKIKVIYLMLYYTLHRTLTAIIL